MDFGARCCDFALWIEHHTATDREPMCKGPANCGAIYGPITQTWPGPTIPCVSNRSKPNTEFSLLAASGRPRSEGLAKLYASDKAPQREKIRRNVHAL